MSTSELDRYKKIFCGGKFLRDGKEVTLKEYPAFDGGGIRSVIDLIKEELDKRTSATILDYGCGSAVHWHKHTLVDRSQNLMDVLGPKVQGFYRYDPAIELYSKKPKGTFDIVVCSDVLEHIPDPELQDFIDQAELYVAKSGVIIYSISTNKSRNSFIDGKNMHCNLKSPDEWVKVLKEYSGCKTRVLFNGSYKY